MLNFKVLREDFEGNREVVITSDKNEVLAWTGEVRNGEEVREYIRVDCAGDARRAAAMVGYKVLDVKMIDDKEFWDLLWSGHKEIMPVNFIDLGDDTIERRKQAVEDESEDVVLFDLSAFNC